MIKDPNYVFPHGQKGRKTHITFQPNKMVSLSHIPWQKLSYRMKKIIKKRKVQHDNLFLKRSKNVPIELINTEEGLASFIRDKYGYGRYSIMFFDKYKRSKRYNFNFKCKLKRCKYFATCTRKNKTIEGISCWRNKKVIHCMSPKIKIEILENANPEAEKDFTYKILFNFNTMHTFPWWRGKKKLTQIKQPRLIKRFKPHKPIPFFKEDELERLSTSN